MSEEFLEVGDISQVVRHRLSSAPADPRWNTPETPEPRIHRIHPYPAKFPSFLTERALAYSRAQGNKPQLIADIFCGCGTVAYEARRSGLAFWGCDINPVAALIARTKSTFFEPAQLRKFTERVIDLAPKCAGTVELAPAAIFRLERWFYPQQFHQLAQILNAIRTIIPERSEYRDAFYCIFSAILKGCSQWKQRSIKPAMDQNKQPSEPIRAFTTQCKNFAKAFEELEFISPASSQIVLGNILRVQAPMRSIDLIVTSPPYVTSYEYADLHQLSSLWLGFADDYRNLRTGSIGSSSQDLNLRRNLDALNTTGAQIVFSLYKQDARAARAIAKYYIDMQLVAKRCKHFLSSKGMAAFVIGNTQYKEIKIDNASHLSEALFSAGFTSVRAARRRISNKSATPYRDDVGRFSRTRTKKEIYAEEFILIAQ